MPYFEVCSSPTSSVLKTTGVMLEWLSQPDEDGRSIGLWSTSHLPFLSSSSLMALAGEGRFIIGSRSSARRRRNGFLRSVLGLLPQSRPCLERCAWPVHPAYIGRLAF